MSDRFDDRYRRRFGRGPGREPRGYGDFERPGWERGYGRRDYWRGPFDRDDQTTGWSDREDELNFDPDFREFGRGYGPDYSRRWQGGRGYDRDYGRGPWDTGREPRGFDRPRRGFEGRERGPSREYPTDRGYEQDFDRAVERGYPGANYEEFVGRREDLYERDPDDSDYTWTYTEYWFIPGPFEGIGPSGYQRSDDRICEEVCDRLTMHGQIDASDVEVSVEDGVVNLTGTVESRRTKRMVEDTAESVAGVNDVNNQLQVQERARQGSMRPTGTRDVVMPGRIRENMPVVGSDGEPVGRVRETRQNEMVVNRPDGHSLTIPFHALKRTNGEIVLNIPASQVDRQNWGVQPATPTTPGIDNASG
ncbi:MAG: BON domain-containing protein [Chloroflexota bacterium]|nr:MAG: BON domain-containing protein [Chloroflexota bacterium]